MKSSLASPNWFKDSSGHCRASPDAMQYKPQWRMEDFQANTAHGIQTPQHSFSKRVHDLSPKRFYSHLLGRNPHWSQKWKSEDCSYCSCPSCKQKWQFFWMKTGRDPAHSFRWEEDGLSRWAALCGAGPFELPVHWPLSRDQDVWGQSDALCQLSQQIS